MLKNRKLYYPFALVTVLSSAFAYIFTSLANNPNLFRVWGATGVRTVLDFGFYVVMIAVVIMIFYANSFVMKNRSKEIGLYSVLGMDKKHLLLMTLVETLFFAVSSLFLSIVTGALLDKLFYAILLKVMKMDVLLVSSFQWSTVFTILEYFGAIFVLIWLLNAGKLGFSTSLNLVRDKRK
ncbi:FtsX-like permease family protein [Streptococcus sp. 20-1249]|uniref:FtsX-like permease family protein n=1 Tax=Streptococcus hepaticus TaxID=3349163 RepID=UPI00374A7B48